jgi:hypothetical protein
MTPQEINIEIAKVCGWRNIHTRNCRFERSKTGQRLCGYHPNGGGTLLPNGETSNANTLPNYHGDLNAMHEAEQTLTDEQYSRYGWTLLGDGHIEAREFLSAPPGKRAEAFLRTLNLWKDTALPCN